MSNFTRINVCLPDYLREMAALPTETFLAAFCSSDLKKKIVSVLHMYMIKPLQVSDEPSDTISAEYYEAGDRVFRFKDVHDMVDPPKCDFPKYAPFDEDEIMSEALNKITCNDWQIIQNAIESAFFMRVYFYMGKDREMKFVDISLIGNNSLNMKFLETIQHFNTSTNAFTIVHVNVLQRMNMSYMGPRTAMTPMKVMGKEMGDLIAKDYSMHATFNMKINTYCPKVNESSERLVCKSNFEEPEKAVNDDYYVGADGNLIPKQTFSGSRIRFFEKKRTHQVIVDLYNFDKEMMSCAAKHYEDGSKCINKSVDHFKNIKDPNSTTAEDIHKVGFMNTQKYSATDNKGQVKFGQYFGKDKMFIVNKKPFNILVSCPRFVALVHIANMFPNYLNFFTIELKSADSEDGDTEDEEKSPCGSTARVVDDDSDDQSTDTSIDMPLKHNKRQKTSTKERPIFMDAKNRIIILDTEKQDPLNYVDYTTYFCFMYVLTCKSVKPAKFQTFDLDSFVFKTLDFVNSLSSEGDTSSSTTSKVSFHTRVDMKAVNSANNLLLDTIKETYDPRYFEVVMCSLEPCMRITYGQAVSSQIRVNNMFFYNFGYNKSLIQ